MSIYNQISQNKRKSFFIITGFALTIILLGWLIGEALDYGYALVPIAILGAAFSTGFSYFFGSNVALSMAGAKEISKRDNPRLFRTVENLAIGSGIVPMPKVYLINDPSINAFATGRDPKHSAIAITQGALDKLEDLELEGVIAHEMSHIKNYDIRTMTIAVVLVGVIALISELFVRSLWSGKRSRNSEGGGIMLLFAFIGVILAPTMAQILKFALSRQREYLADASAALLTRYPEGLARALEKIKADNTPMKKANTAIAHLYIANPLKNKHGEKIANLFSTHPPLDDRIARLRAM